MTNLQLEILSIKLSEYAKLRSPAYRLKGAQVQKYLKLVIKLPKKALLLQLLFLPYYDVEHLAKLVTQLLR